LGLLVFEDYGTMADIDQFDQKKPKTNNKKLAGLESMIQDEVPSNQRSTTENAQKNFPLSKPFASGKVDNKKLFGLEGMIEDEMSNNQTISPTRESSKNQRSQATLSMTEDAQNQFPFTKLVIDGKSGLELQQERERLHLEEMQKSVVLDEPIKNYKKQDFKLPTSKNSGKVGLEAQIESELQQGGENHFGGANVHDKKQKFGLEAQIQAELNSAGKNVSDPSQISRMGLEAQIARELEQEINPHKRSNKFGLEANIDREFAHSKKSESDLGFGGLEDKIKKELNTTMITTETIILHTKTSNDYRQGLQQQQ